MNLDDVCRKISKDLNKLNKPLLKYEVREFDIYVLLEIQIYSNTVTILS